MNLTPCRPTSRTQAAVPPVMFVGTVDTLSVAKGSDGTEAETKVKDITRNHITYIFKT